ncbi:hypothetical protein [Saccharothrix deserti]|uniref:hypothetical protein n=1 Tax=Saccharothrix deserti TaxID=2593674 RepID=UPI00131A9360|nr:hypothetical protein [Saccharothrix deserti]
MAKLKDQRARRITADWAALFPEFSVWRPLRLLRRIGPVLQGISLERTVSAERYSPTAHVHSLAREFPVISLSLAHHLHPTVQGRDEIDVDRHELEFRAAAVRLEERSTLPLRRWPDLAEIVHAYRAAAVGARQGRLPAGVVELEDCVLVPAAAGERALAGESLRFVVETARRWSKYEAPTGWSDTREWLDWLEARVDDPTDLMAVVDEQVTGHGLSGVGTTGLRRA